MPRISSHSLDGVFGTGHGAAGRFRTSVPAAGPAAAEGEALVPVRAGVLGPSPEQWLAFVGFYV